MKICHVNRLVLEQLSQLASSIRGAALLLATLLALGVPRIDAAGNHLDYTFSGDGKVLAGVAGDAAAGASDLAIQGDGKIVVAGHVNADDFLVMRFNADGSLDNTFSGDGKVETDILGSDSAYAVAIQADGKIVVAGRIGTGWAVVRYNTNGSLDSTFSGDGKVPLTFASIFGVPTALSVQSNGKIVLSGGIRISNVSSWGFARLNSDGSLDATFDGDGWKELTFGGIPAFVTDSIVQSDGKIVGTGPLGSGPRNVLLVRLDSDGSLDPTFDNEGIVITNFGGDDFTNSIKRTFDGKYVVAGGRSNGGLDTAWLAVARYNADGSPDTTFSGDGQTLHDLYGLGYETCVDMVVAVNGEITLLGYAFDLNGFMLVRFRPDGLYDSVFGPQGRVNTIFGPDTNEFEFNPLPVAIALSGLDNKLVAAGTYSGDFAVARYNREGIAAESDFNEDGSSDPAVFRPSDGNWYVYAISITHWGQAGDIPVPGDYDGDGRVDHAVFRNGVWYILKSSDGGYIITQFGFGSDKPVQADYDGDGKTDIAVYRPSDGVWHLLRSSFGYTSIAFGIAEDKPAPGDYDGDGLSDLAVFRPSTGVWYIQRSVYGLRILQFGLPGDQAVAFDFDRDTRTDIGVFRPSTGIWYLIPSQNPGVLSVHFGLSTDIPVSLSYPTIGVFRPSNGVWYGYNGLGGNALQWGAAGDIPIPAAYRPQ